MLPEAADASQPADQAATYCCCRFFSPLLMPRRAFAAPCRRHAATEATLVDMLLLLCFRHDAITPLLIRLIFGIATLIRYASASSAITPRSLLSPLRAMLIITMPFRFVTLFSLYYAFHAVALRLL